MKKWFQTVLLCAVLTGLLLACSAGAAENNYTLEKEIHVSYMTGKSVLRFAPDEPLKRSEAAQMINTLLREKPPVTKQFSDVKGKPCEQAANALYSAGLLQGRDGRFEPEAALTRAELAAILYRFCEKIGLEPVCSFSDVPHTHWAYRSIAALTAHGWITGYDDGTFRPEQALTRAETAVLMNRFLGRKPDLATIRTAEGVRIFLDVACDLWAYGDIMEATIPHQYLTMIGREHWISFTSPEIGLQSGYYMFDHHLYYVEPEHLQFARNTSLAGYTFDENGRYTTGSARLDELLYQVVSKYCTNAAGAEENLRQVYNYVRDHFQYQTRALVARGATGWELKYAEPMMESHYGNCYSWASVFMYLARCVGFEAYCRSGTVGVQREDHGWTEIMFDGEWYIFDPELEHSNQGRLLFYKIPYDNGYKHYYLS